MQATITELLRALRRASRALGPEEASGFAFGPVAGADDIIARCTELEAKLRALDVWGANGAPTPEALDAAAPPARRGSRSCSRSRSRSRSRSPPRRRGGRSWSRDRSDSRSRSGSRGRREVAAAPPERKRSRFTSGPPQPGEGGPSGAEVAVEAAVRPMDRPAKDFNAQDVGTRDYHDLPLASARAGGGVALVNRAQEVQSNLHQTRHARRIYVCGFPPNTTEQQLITFFNDAVAMAFGEHATDFGGPIFVSNIFSNTQKNFCFIGVCAPDARGGSRASRAAVCMAA